MKHLASGLIAVVMIAPAARAAELGAVDIKAEAKVASAYIWRGWVINDEPVVQPAVTLKARNGVSFGLWGTWDLAEPDEEVDNTRMDISLDYEQTQGPHTVSAGVEAFIYRDSKKAGKEDTIEASLGYTLEAVASPSVTVYYDFGEIEGTYVTVGLGHTIPLAEGGAALGFDVLVAGADEDYLISEFGYEEDAETDRAAFQPEGTALVDVTVKVSLLIEVNERTVLKPQVRYMALLDTDIKDAMEAIDEETDHVAYSLTLGFVF